MTTANLISKLNKMNITSTIVDMTGYNKEVQFSINGLNYSADFNIEKMEIESFSRDICFDNTNQEMQRRFFSNFSQLIKYANR